MRKLSAKDFPILKRKIRGRRLVYLDNAATTQKPSVVIDAMADFYKNHNANIHRGIHTLSQEATLMYEEVRDKVQKFINAKHREEIVFTKSATEAINLVAATWGEQNIKRGDEILLTEMEHHSNLVPWQQLAKRKKARLKYIPVVSPSPGLRPPSPVKGEGKLDLSGLDKTITLKTKLVGVVHLSNFLGTINPVEKIIKVAHRAGAVVLVDGAQAAGHIKVDVQKLNCDFYVFSGHKMYGPTGVGVLYGKKELLDKMPPYQFGGEMIKEVKWQETTFKEPPYRFEAGTMPIAEVVGLGAAIDYINKIGIENITNSELRTTNYALKELERIKGVRVYGPSNIKERGPIISFNVMGPPSPRLRRVNIPPHDLASILDEHGVAIRTGHHCNMPIHTKMGLEATARVSFAIYNSEKDITALIKGIKSAKQAFRLN